MTSKLLKSHRVKFSKSWTPPQNNLTPYTTLSEGLATFCSKGTMVGSTTYSVLTPIILPFAKSWMNLSLLNPKNNTKTCWFYILIVISWRLRFCWPLFQPWTPLGKFPYFGKYKHGPKVVWGNLSPSACDHHNWSTWHLKSHTLPFSLCWLLTTLWLFLIIMKPWLIVIHFHLFWSLFPIFGRTFGFWVTLFLISP